MRRPPPRLRAVAPLRVFYTKKKCELLVPTRVRGTSKKLISVLIADPSGVNVYVSERERSRIIRRQFWGAQRVGLFFEVPYTIIFAHGAIDSAGG